MLDRVVEGVTCTMDVVEPDFESGNAYAYCTTCWGWHVIA